ncbi:sugar ABC transporter permease [Nocardioidaceae bacterium]|nr:sugar ABC transporter permease [Nocardioidaceae bacterium]
MSTPEKFLQMGIAIALFIALMSAILLLSSRFKNRSGERLQAAAFLLPAVLLVAFGLLYPALKTIYQSLFDSFGTNFVGTENYQTIITNPDLLVVLRNTLFWVLLTPLLATFIGLIYAVLVDGSRFEKQAKALVFLPMAISLVGATIIWKFVYAYRDNDVTLADGSNPAQIGLLNAMLDGVGLPTFQFLTSPPWNTFFLIVILIWIQAGFAMVILSASIKAIPEDIIEAARLDGVSGVKMFRHITVPSIRPALIVVLTTISIATLKVFDIVQTVGGQFDTSVLAYEFYRQFFVANNQGLATALATVIFVLVIPIIFYNVRQFRRLEAR